MVDELKKLKWPRFKGEPHWICCFAHILNLIVKTILRSFGTERNSSQNINIDSEHKKEANIQQVDHYTKGHPNSQLAKEDDLDSDEDDKGVTRVT
ncbi:hypothetical protein Pst134EA_000907 [Puccinia striiformis f. sp. tritici]|uniref:hypothetical protein n=1 Tax=Puccinia striiformis f. sp. tritici TaxID=168172 RepID=UPI0020075A5C|nr:hypothetical protein Pst134EA_000907 [Puccinia striiformis f. sp. tritici]KAH9467096.1 hypothetical protein Pst134EB_002124 [Puccinia striiformis f. sp. tritici]KAH9473844.1 hypothetical protein Pst134EA_000907 [Puccinia striiformis f. sp. tritici]